MYLPWYYLIEVCVAPRVCDCTLCVSVCACARAYISYNLLTCFYYQPPPLLFALIILYGNQVFGLQIRIIIDEILPTINNVHVRKTKQQVRVVGASLLVKQRFYVVFPNDDIYIVAMASI